MSESLKTIDITGFFKKFCIAIRTRKKTKSVSTWSFFNEICPLGKWNSFAVKYLLCKCEIFANANVGKFHFTSNEVRYFTISLRNYFTFCHKAKYFTKIFFCFESKCERIWTSTVPPTTKARPAPRPNRVTVIKIAWPHLWPLTEKSVTEICFSEILMFEKKKFSLFSAYYILDVDAAGVSPVAPTQ